MKKLFAFLFVISVILQLSAQCTKDTDCKGNRICQQGECVSPEVKDSNLNAEFTPTTGWAKGAAIFGFIETPLVLAMNVAAAVGRETGEEPEMYGTLSGVTSIMVAVSVPIINVGSNSARHSHRKSPARKILAYVAYGLMMGSTLAMTIAGAGFDIEPESYQLAIHGILGTTSLLAISVDSYMNYKYAKKDIEKQRGTQGNQVSLGVAPINKGAMLFTSFSF